MEQHKIPPALIVNFDQTPIKYVPVGNESLAEKGTTNVTIEGSGDKRCITGTFAISLAGSFLPIQLIYAGKTTQSIPKFKFPAGFSLSANPKHFSNTQESLKYLKEIIIPYMQNQRLEHDLPDDQMSLVIMDVFKGQMTAPVLECLKENNVCFVNVPPNMTKYYQPLDLTVNGYAKRFMKRKFNEWYSRKIKQQLDDGVSLEDVTVKLQLTTLKPLQASWIVEFYNHMTTMTGIENIESGWRATGITDALRLGSSHLPSIDPFNDIDPMLVEVPVEDEQVAMTSDQLERHCAIGHADESDEDSEWEDIEQRSAFDIFK